MSQLDNGWVDVLIFHSLELPCALLARTPIATRKRFDTSSVPTYYLVDICIIRQIDVGVN